MTRMRSFALSVAGLLAIGGLFVPGAAAERLYLIGRGDGQPVPVGAEVYAEFGIGSDELGGCIRHLYGRMVANGDFTDVISLSPFPPASSCQLVPVGALEDGFVLELNARGVATLTAFPEKLAVGWPGSRPECIWEAPEVTGTFNVPPGVPEFHLSGLFTLTSAAIQQGRCTNEYELSATQTVGTAIELIAHGREGGYGPVTLERGCQLGEIAPPEVEVETTTLPEATRGLAYEAVLAACGGTAPYKWKKVGKLPRGLKVTKTGVIQGTPRSKLAPGSYRIGVKATDAEKPKRSATSTVTLKVK
jgi:hypothetical protein